VLKVIPPHGWSFEPEQVPIKFDGLNDDCSLEKDVNFVFKGFGITGKIGIFGKPTGARGVKVELRSEKREKIGQTISDNTGIFSFSPIVPGKYFISVAHEKWHFLNSEITVVVETGNTEIPPNMLTVSGFDIEGKMANDGQPFGLILYNAKGQKTLTKCTTNDIPQVSNKNPNYEPSPLCYTTTSKANGEYIFNAVSPGKYLIAPYFENKNIKFHIRPEFVEIELGRDTLKVPENFEVTGFSVSGRVLLSHGGHGVYDAKIRLNGREVATTDRDGFYVLENIQAGTYTIQVSGDDMEFKDHTVKISLANPTLPEIVVSGFKVCGQVISKSSQKVAITKEGSTFHTEIPTKENSGDWCVYLGIGHYLVEVLTSEADKNKGVQ
jgi:protocatechuate 3,4-dioxygenase beta subunit